MDKREQSYPIVYVSKMWHSTFYMFSTKIQHKCVKVKDMYVNTIIFSSIFMVDWRVLKLHWYEIV